MARRDQVSTYREADTKQAGAKRRRWTLEFKRELVAATFEPGSSVSVVARRHDINANQLGPLKNPSGCDSNEHLMWW
jgi:transposase-like protein